MSPETITKRETPPKAFAMALRAAGSLAMLAMLSTATAHAYRWYSGASVGSNGTVYGWGVTDGTAPPGMSHLAYVTTTLTSPVKGRQAYINSGGQQNTARADVSLSYDPADLGSFTVQSISSAYCYWGLIWFIYQQLSQSSTTVPFVVITLRNGSGQSVSTDNTARAAYYGYNGTYVLGTFENLYSSWWQTSVELVGNVFPANYTGYITLNRQIVNLRDYDNSTTATKSYPPCPGNPTCDDTSSLGYRDDNPHSSNFYWYSRISVYRPSGQVTTVLKTDVPNDNVSGTGTTPISWNLQ
jgi:hypothetical protein